MELIEYLEQPATEEGLSDLAHRLQDCTRGELDYVLKRFQSDLYKAMFAEAYRLNREEGSYRALEAFYRDKFPDNERKTAFSSAKTNLNTGLQRMAFADMEVRRCVAEDGDVVVWVLNTRVKIYNTISSVPVQPQIESAHGQVAEIFAATSDYNKRVVLAALAGSLGGVDLKEVQQFLLPGAEVMAVVEALNKEDLGQRDFEIVVRNGVAIIKPRRKDDPVAWSHHFIVTSFQRGCRAAIIENLREEADGSGELKALRAQVERLDEALGEELREKELLEAQLRGSFVAHVDLEAERDRLQVELERVQAASSGETAQIDPVPILEWGVAGLLERVEILQREKAELESRVAGLMERIELMSAERASLEAEISVLKQRSADPGANAEADANLSRMESQRNELGREVVGLRQRVRNLEVELEELRAKLRTKSNEGGVDQLRAEIRELREQLRNESAELARLREELRNGKGRDGAQGQLFKALRPLPDSIEGIELVHRYLDKWLGVYLEETTQFISIEVLRTMGLQMQELIADTSLKLSYDVKIFLVEAYTELIYWYIALLQTGDGLITKLPRARLESLVTFLQSQRKGGVRAPVS